MNKNLNEDDFKKNLKEYINSSEYLKDDPVLNELDEEFQKLKQQGHKIDVEKFKKLL